MGMQIGGDSGEDQVNSTINTTPLVDIMLVLLIIFIITSPVVLDLTKVQLPAEKNEDYHPDAKNVIITVSKDGDIYFGGMRTPVTSEDALFELMAKEAVKVPQPEVHIRGDQNARYEAIGKTMLTVQRAGIAKVGFVLEPPPKG
ncbi:biopolymer transporter ExbD [Undibacterium seohonense]|jgi:biopolymer transport protein ExbD|uniref:Biopolymer transporter ExbD n=1 Tax=Undibacterium seohonense TaxID=1344950 RepID=A0ABR6X6K4_9BURK|nr:biopolymer transporter ExbD [Undibacterium seohonense]MBC3808594.1 biopolymer transporter ExbD [Undibacterium seohonense]